MMQLLDDWPNQTTVALIRELFDRAESPALKMAVARALIWSYFDLLLRTRWRRERAEIRIRESPPLIWRVNDTRFMYLQVVDDSLLDAVAKRRLRPNDVIIVPPRHGRLVYEALGGSAPNAPSIRAVDDFMDFRHAMTSMDTGWDWRRTTRRMLQAFNRRARQDPEAAGIVVALHPPSPRR